MTDRRRYAVLNVMRDGVPVEVSYWNTLEDALAERDLQRRYFIGVRIHFYVIDREDEERGHLDHDHLYETEAA